MATLGDFIEKLESIDLIDEVGKIIAANADTIKDMNKKQMLAGKNNKGDSLPSILGDPYFKKPGADERYAAFKQKLFPETPFGVSNFTVLNVFHNSILVFRKDRDIVYNSPVLFASDIERKTNNTVFGLNADSRATAWQLIIRPAIIEIMAKKLGAKTT